VITFIILSVYLHGSVSPDWPTGRLGVGAWLALTPGLHPGQAA
jgi:hypothetical protein